MEEIADVELLLIVLNYDNGRLLAEKRKMMQEKLQRWVTRLEERVEDE